MAFKMKGFSAHAGVSPMKQKEEKVYESESGREQVAKKKGLAKLGSQIKTAITGKVGKEYKHQGTIRQDVTKKRAKKLKRKGKDKGLHTWDAGETHTNIKKRGAWDAKTK